MLIYVAMIMICVCEGDDDGVCNNNNGVGAWGGCWLIKVIICENDYDDGDGGLSIDEGTVMMEIM